MESTSQINIVLNQSRNFEIQFNQTFTLNYSGKPEMFVKHQQQFGGSTSQPVQSGSGNTEQPGNAEQPGQHFTENSTGNYHAQSEEMSQPGRPELPEQPKFQFGEFRRQSAQKEKSLEHLVNQSKDVTETFHQPTDSDAKNGQQIVAAQDQAEECISTQSTTPHQDYRSKEGFAENALKLQAVCEALKKVRLNLSLIGIKVKSTNANISKVKNDHFILGKAHKDLMEVEEKVANNYIQVKNMLAETESLMQAVHAL